MSNLYKQRYIVNDSNHARVIDSNVLVAEKLEELAKEVQKSETPKADADGFVAGLSMEAVEVVPKDTVSLEEAMEQVSQEAEEILADARKKAEEILSDARSQAETIKTQAKESGYAKGLQEGSDRAALELEERRSQMETEQKLRETDYRQKLEELEPRLVDVIAHVFEKVFHVQFDDKKEILIYLIQNTILGIEGTKEFQVRVSTEDFEFLESHRNEITERLGQAVKVELMADVNMKNGQCIIETDSGVFDCGRDVQLDNLIKALRSLSL